MRRFVASALALLVVGCDGETNDAARSRQPAEATGVPLRLPGPLLGSRIRPEDIALEVTVNGQPIRTTRNGGRWTAEILVSEDASLNIRIAFTSDGIALASTSRQLPRPTSDLSLSFGQSDYVIADDDGDGFSNIDEIDGGSDPFDPTIVPEPFDERDTSPIAGLYDASFLFATDDGSLLFDAVFVDVLADARYVVYDYQDDERDGGEDCYFVSDPIDLLRTGRNEYDFTENFDDFDDFFVPFPAQGNGIARFVVDSAPSSDPDLDSGESLEFDDSGLPGWTRFGSPGGDRSFFNRCT